MRENKHMTDDGAQTGERRDRSSPLREIDTDEYSTTLAMSAVVGSAVVETNPFMPHELPPAEVQLPTLTSPLAWSVKATRYRVVGF